MCILRFRPKRGSGPPGRPRREHRAPQPHLELPGVQHPPWRGLQAFRTWQTHPAVQPRRAGRHQLGPVAHRRNEHERGIRPNDSTGSRGNDPGDDAGTEIGIRAADLAETDGTLWEDRADR